MRLPVEGDTIIVKPLNGQSFSAELDQKLGKGGEGVVYTTDKNGVVAKVFQSGQEKASKFEAKLKLKITKIEAMLRSPPDQKVKTIAWPEGIVYFEGKACGYAMPEVKGNITLVEASNPEFRYKKFPHLDIYLLLLLAENVARVVVKVHKQQHILGDIKELNWLFDDRLHAHLIDTDSFSIFNPSTHERYKADAITAEYAPPEYHRRSKIQLTEAHDNFSLAVLFHYLIYGLHPYSGGKRSGERDTIRYIKKGEWLYDAKLKIERAHGDPPFDIVGVQVQELFRRAFVEGYKNPSKRPSAQEWADGLNDARYDLVWCREHASHVYDCNIKVQKTGGKDCPWCDMYDMDAYVFPPKSDLDKSKSMDFALRNIENITSSNNLADMNLANAKRMLDANPEFRKDSRLVNTVAKVTAYEKREREISEFIGELKTAHSDKNAQRLIDAAKRAWSEAELEDIARQIGLGDLLDEAKRAEQYCKRLDEAIDKCKADIDGRFLLANEEKLLKLFREQKKNLETYADLSSRYAARLKSAEERVTACKLLQEALKGNVAEPRYENLKKLFKTWKGRFKEIANREVSGAGGMAQVAQALIEVSEGVSASSEFAVDKTLLERWDNEIKPASGDISIINQPAVKGESPLIREIDILRKNLTEYTRFKRLVDNLDMSLTQLERDKGVIAADPTQVFSEKRRNTFQKSELWKVLQKARWRVEAIEEVERLAAHSDRDVVDPELVKKWHSFPDKELLTISGFAERRISHAELRMDRLSLIKTLWEVTQLEDTVQERDEIAFIDAVEMKHEAGDLLGLEFYDNKPLGEWYWRAKNAFEERDKLKSIIERVEIHELTLDGERKIVDAAKQFAQAINEKTHLFQSLLKRIHIAKERIDNFLKFELAIKELDGEVAKDSWSSAAKHFTDFPPIKEIKQDVLELIEAQTHLDSFCDCVLFDPYNDKVIINQAEKNIEAFKLKAARKPIVGIEKSGIDRKLTPEGILMRSRKRIKMQPKRDDLQNALPGSSEARMMLAEVPFVWDKQDFSMEEPEFAMHYAEMEEAFDAAKAVDGINDALTQGNSAMIEELWNEKWHRIMPSEQVSIQAIRRIIKSTLDKSGPPSGCSIERLSAYHIKIRWRWRKKALAKGNEHSTGECVTIWVGDETAPTPMSTEQVLTIFRNSNDDEGSLDLEFRGRRFTAKIFSSFMIDGIPLQGREGKVIFEKERELKYRLVPGFINSENHLHLESNYPFQIPELHLIHEKTNRIVQHIREVELDDGGQLLIPINAGGKVFSPVQRLWHCFQRILHFPHPDTLYRLETVNSERSSSWLRLTSPPYKNNRTLNMIINN